MPYVGRRAPIDEEQRRREEEQQRNQGPAANEQPAFGDSQQPGYQPEPQTYQHPQQPAYQPPQQQQELTFKTYTGDYRTPFGQEDLDERYKQTYQALQKNNPTMDDRRMLEDSFNITNRFAYQISDSVDAGIGNPQDYERNWEAANNWWQREVDRKNAQYFTEGKSYDELRQAWDQQGFRSDYQRRQDEAAAYEEWARQNRGQGQTAPQLMDDPFAQQAQEYADLLETMTRANEGQNVHRELLGRVDYIAKNQFGGDYTAAANWMRQQMEQYQALSRQTAEENARRTAEAQAAGQGAPVEDYETRNEWMEWARDHRDQRDEAAAFWQDPMATWRQMQETNINDLTDVQRDMWSRLMNVLPDETVIRLQAGMEPTEQDLQQISQAAQKQAGYLNDTRSIYGDAGQETETQKVYEEAMRQTLEGARQWLEEARGTGDEQKARDNLYFVENREKYNALDQQPDFAEKSRPDPNVMGRNILYSYINGDMDTVMKAAAAGDQNANAGRLIQYDLMTQDEKDVFTYLWNAEGESAAREYLDYLQYALNERSAEQSAQYMREMGSDGFWGGALASVLSVPMGITRGLGYLETALQALDPSKPVDRNTAFNILGAMGDAGREGVMQQVDWQANILGKDMDLFDFLYGTTMSGVDSMAAGYLGGPIGGAILLGSGAAQSTMQDIYARDGSDTQALLGGLVSGVFESLFEKVSLGEFFEQAGKLGKQGFKDWMKTIGREAFVNFSEEFNTEVANILYDNLVNGDKSEYSLEMKRLTDLGMTEKEAYAKVFWDKVGQALEAGAGGAVMGAAFGVVGNVNSSRATNKMNTESGTHLLNEKMGQVLKDVGMTLPEGSAARKMAEGYDTGKATAKQTGELYREIWNAVKNSPKMQDIMSRTMSDGLRFVLENDGAGLVSRDAADGLNAMLQGQEMTEEQAQAIAGSDVAMTMMHEMFVGEEAADAAARQREQEKKNEKSQPETPAERKNREAAHEEGAYRTEAAETAGENSETAEAAGPAGEERTQPMTPEERKNREAAHEEGAYRTQETAPGAADQAGEAQPQTQTQTQPMTPAERKNREAAHEEGAYRTQEAQRQLEEADQAYRQAAQAAEDARANGESQDVIAAAEQRAEDARARYQEAQKKAADTTAAERKNREAAHEEGAYRTQEGQKRTVTTAKVGGQDSVVTGVQQDQDGHMTATTQDGRTVDLDEVDTDDARKTMLRRASRMDGDAAADMMNRYQEGQDADEYSRGYQRVYNGAKNGKGLDEIRSIFKDVGLTKEQAQAAWEAGMRARQAQQAQAKQRNADLAKQNGFQALEEDGKTRQRGVVFADVSQELTETQAGQLKIIDEWLRRRGSEIQVQVHDSITNKSGRSIANGKYDTGTNTIHLALDADNDAMTRTASHEIYHYIQSWNGDAAKQLQKDVLDLLRNTEGYDLDKRIRQVQDRYRKGGKTLTEQQALDEITADSMLDVLGNEENMKALMKTAEPGTMAKIREWLQNAVKELQAIMQRVAKGSPEAKALLPQVEAMQRIQQQFETAEQTASENYRQAQEGATRSAQENSYVKEYMQGMQAGEDAQTALNGLVSQLFVQSQQEWMRQNPDADLDEAMQRFADALKRYRTENTALSTALEGAGFAAGKNGDMNTALSYAADQLLALEERTGEEAGVQYSAKEEKVYDYTKPFSEQVDDWLQKKIPSNNMLLVGGTPLVFQQVGFSALPMTIDQDHVSYAIMGKEEALDDHNLGVEILKQLPELMEKPVAIIQSETRSDDSVVAIVKATINGKQVMAAVEAGGVGRFNNEFYNVNEITTTQGRGNAITKLLEDAIKTENNGGIGVFYINKTEARSLYARAGVQFPGSALQDGLNHSIFDAGSPVKREYVDQTKTRQFERWFGNSKVTENGKAKGKPKVMYHGTNAYEEFTVFKSGKKGYLGPGIYLTDKENRADYYAKKNGGEGRVYKVYVSMQNPLILTNEQNPGKAILHTIYGNDTVYNKRAGKAAWDTEIIKKADIEKLKAMGYDGIISNTEYNNYHESEVMAFEPTQLKSAMDGEMANIGTFDKDNPDIRYSMKDTGDADLDMKDEDVARSVEDDAELFAQVTEDQDAREALELVNKLDESTGELTKGQWESRRGDVADKILQETGSGYSRLKLMKELGTLYQAMDDKTMDFGEKVQYAREIMRKVLNEGGQAADMDESTQEVLRLVRTRGFYLTDEMKSELRETGNSRGFYQKNFGRMALRQKAQNGKGSFLSLSELWTELNEVMPGAFPLDASEADMPMMLDAWLDHNGKKEVSSYYGRDAGAYATDLAYQAMLEYYDVPGALRKTQDIRKEFRDKLQTYRQTFQQKQEEKMKTSQERAQLTKEKQKLRNEIGQSVKYMNTRIVGQTDVRHVPEGLRGAAERAVRPFLNSTGVFDRQQLARLRGEYASMAKDGANHGLDAARAYDPEIQDKIERLERTLDGRRLSECTKAELEDIRDIVGNLKKMITEANEMQVAGRKTTLDAEAQSFMRQMKDTARTGKKWLQKVQDVAYRNMTPTYYADKVGGVMKDCVDDLMDGQNRWAFNARNAKERFEEIAKKHSLNDWINDENHLKFETSRGETIELSRDEAMALYATWKRETTNTRQNANHLRIGGFMYGKNADYDGVDTQAPHAVNAEDMQQVMDYLGKDQMAFVDEMVDYLSTTMADLGNETSMRLYGYKKFGEKYYYPYSSDNRFLMTELEEAVDTGKAGKPGFSKATVKNASNPVVLGGFLETWANHVNEMCLYNAFAETTDNLFRLYNYKTPGQMHIDAATGKEYVEAPTSLKLEMEKGLGEGAVQYLRTLVKDVNGGVRAEERTRTGKMLSLFKKGSVAGNLSVVLQQPSAFARAMNMVSPKYILSLKGVGRLRAAREAMYKYSGVAIIKEMGRFDTGVGASAKEWILDSVQEGNKAKRVLGKMDDITGYGAEKADEWTWAFLWAGVENEIRDKMPELTVGSEEYYQAVAGRFNDVCNHTQVYDSVLSKSEMMRSNSTMDKVVTSFMAEPTLTANMLVDALQNIRKPGGKAKAARAAAVFVNAAFVNALLKSFATALRKGKDEDRTYLEKYLGDVTGNFLDDVSPAGILGLVPLARDVVSIFQGYDVERSDMDAVQQVYKAMQAWQNENATLEDQLQLTAGAVGNMFGIPVKNVWRDLEGIYRTVVNGQPISETSGRDIKYTVADNLNSYWPFNIWDPSRNAYYDRIEAAMMKDDEGKAREMMGYMTETNGVKEETLKTGVKGEMKDSVARGLMSPERAADLLHQYFGEDENKAYFDAEKWKQEAEHAGEGFKYSKTGELMDAVTKGEDITDAAKTLTDHGKSEKDVLSAVKTGIRDMYIQGTMDRETAENRLKQYIPTMNDTDRYWLMDEWDFKLENGTEAKYEKYGKMWDAIDNGGDVRSEAQRMTSHGVKKETVSTAITKQYKQKYIDLYKTNPAAAADLKARILNAYAALGFDREKKNQDIAKWLTEKKK